MAKHHLFTVKIELTVPGLNEDDVREYLWNEFKIDDFIPAAEIVQVNDDLLTTADENWLAEFDEVRHV